MTADARKSLATLATVLLPVASAGFVIYLAAESRLVPDFRVPPAASLSVPVRLVGASCLPLAVWCGAFLRRHERALRQGWTGFCPGCGYDLSATPARCPECGRVP